MLFDVQDAFWWTRTKATRICPPRMRFRVVVLPQAWQFRRYVFGIIFVTPHRRLPLRILDKRNRVLK